MAETSRRKEERNDPRSQIRPPSSHRTEHKKEIGGLGAVCVGRSRDLGPGRRLCNERSESVETRWRRCEKGKVRFILCVSYAKC